MLVDRSQHDTMALMIVEGWDSQTISDALNIDAKIVQQYCSKAAPESFKRILAGYREKITTAVVERRVRFVSMTEKAYSRIQQALDSKDERIAVETAWRVIDQVSPQAAPGLSVEMNFTQNTQVNQQILETTGSLVGLLNEIKAGPQVDFDKHLRTGSEALPAAVQAAIAEREDSTLTLEPEEFEDLPEGSPAPGAKDPDALYDPSNP